MRLQKTSFIKKQSCSKGRYRVEEGSSEMTTEKGGRDFKMLFPTIIMGLIAGILILAGYLKGGGQHVTGLRIAGNMTIQILPLLVCAFTVAGMAQVLIPHDILAKWVGTESGIRGIMIGTVAGGFAPGGPYVSLPIAATLLRAGASVGTMVAFLTGWSLWAVGRLPMEVGIMGWKFTLVRLACTFFFPPLAGILANRLFPHFI
ncbi:MAG: permease [Syntrophobacterales bacterium]|nr:MAG: permease [Syntrophobacterales bacterium]